MLKCLVIPNTIIIYYLSNIKRTVFGWTRFSIWLFWFSGLFLKGVAFCITAWGTAAVGAFADAYLWGGAFCTFVIVAVFGKTLDVSVCWGIGATHGIWSTVRGAEACAAGVVLGHTSRNVNGTKTAKSFAVVIALLDGTVKNRHNIIHSF